MTDDAAKLPRHEWAHLTAVFDGNAGEMRLYLDGQRVAEATGLATGPVTLPVPFSLGRNRDTGTVFGAEMFEFSMFAGAVGQLELYDVALDDTAVADKHANESSNVQSTSWEELVLFPDRYDGDPFRPTYHAIPPQHWMNEPHAPLYYEPDGTAEGEGRYHLFYQHNAKGPYFHHQSWGHWVSDDLIHWEPLPQALVPKEDLLDPTGCFAGDTVLDANDEPAALYTGAFAPTVDEEVGQGVISASADDPSDPNLREWSQDATGRTQDDITFPRPPEFVNGGSPYPEPLSQWDQNNRFGYPPHFRDPHVWREYDEATGEYEWIAVTGSAYTRIDETAPDIPDEWDGRRVGAAWVYTSPDFQSWTFQGELIDWRLGPVLPDDIEATDEPFIANEWELPVVLPLDGSWEDATKHMLCFNPLWQILDPDGYDIPALSVFDIYYWVGEWNPNGEYAFVPDHEDPRLVDYGDSHFTGCSGMYDGKPGKDRSVVFTIAQDYRLPRFHYEGGWAHNAGLPMEVSIGDDDRIRVAPVEEVISLRTEQLYDVSEAQPQVVNEDLEGMSAETVEVNLTLRSNDAEQYGIRLRRTADGGTETYIVYDEASGTINVDRRASTDNPDLLLEDSRQSDLVHGGEVRSSGDTLELRLFVDRSMVECYVENRKSVTTRAYPEDADADGLRIFYVGDVTVESMTVWDLEDINANL